MDDEADDTTGEYSENESESDGDLSDFIDNTLAIEDGDIFVEQKKLETQKNKFLLSNHIASLSKIELDAIGLTFAYTKPEHIFE